MEKSILPIWQPLGRSTHLIAKKVSEKFGMKTSHTGTLDPMAEGVIIVLLGEDRLKKYDFAKWHKTYEFEVVFGISTDTYDGMGLINFITQQNFTEQEISKALKSFVGDYTQEVPPFSAIKVLGKEMHKHTRSGNDVTLPTRSGQILEAELIKTYELSLEEVSTKICEKIAKVSGDFRQQEITNRWQELPQKNQTFQIAQIKIKTTKGLYVRSFAQDLAKKLAGNATVFSLTRTQNGEFSKKECKTLEELGITV